MSTTVSAKLENYEKKYPLYTREAIIDKMLDDGAITFAEAKRIKEGKSIFFLDNDFEKQPLYDVNMTEIMGGKFSKNKETNFNRQIEPTFQAKGQGDCWLLSDINALNQTEWGRQVIRDAILPDVDGSGGVTIYFKGSPIEQKTFHFTAEQIDDARQSGRYSKGDDDMIAFELATEETFRIMVKEGLATRCADDKRIMSHDASYRSYIFYGVENDEFLQYPISKLLGVDNSTADFFNVINERENGEEEKDKVLKWFCDNMENASATCGFCLMFGGIGDEKSPNYIKGGHAYAIKDIKYGKEVTLLDPYYSDFEIKVSWDIFKYYVMDLKFSFKDDETKKSLYNVLPKNYDNLAKQAYERNKKEIEESNKKLEAERARQDSTFKVKIDSLHREREKQIALWELEDEKRNKKNTQNLFDNLKDFENTQNTMALFKASVNISVDNVIELLETYPDYVLWCDSACSGWGNGSRKYSLIYPVISSLEHKALLLGIDKETVLKFSKTCKAELNAMFYTDEKVIIEEVNKMKELIKNSIP